MSTVRPRMRRETRDKIVGYLLLLPSAVLLVSFVLVPFGHVALMSLQSIGPGELSGKFIGVQNYIWALSSAEFQRNLLNTGIWMVSTVAVEMSLGLLFAVLLNKNLKGRGLARALVLFPYLIPTVVAVMIWRYQFHDLVGIVNYMLMSIGLIKGPVLWLDSPQWAMLAVVIVDGWKHFPFVVLVLMAALQGIPKDQYEAASIDGASGLQQFLHVTLPAIQPVILVTALIRAIYNINSFDIIYLLTGGGPVNATTTMPILIYRKAFVDFQIGRGSAAAMLMFAGMLCLLALYSWLYQRSNVHER